MPEAANARVPHLDPATGRWWLPITHNDVEWWAEMQGFGGEQVRGYAGKRWVVRAALPDGAVPLMRVDTTQWLLAEQAERGRAAFVDLGVQHARAQEELAALRTQQQPTTVTAEAAAASAGRNTLGTSSNVWDAVATLRWLRKDIHGADERALARAESIAEGVAARLRRQERDDDRLADLVIQTACGVQGTAAPTPTAMRKAVKLAITRTREAERAKTSVDTDDEAGDS